MAKWIPLRLSGAERWMACPGSAKATHGVVERSNKYADRGTVAHALLEIALRLHLDDEDMARYVGRCLVGQPQIPVDEEMVRSIAHALMYVRGYMAKNPKAEFHPETSVDLSARFNNRPVTGTSDIVIDHVDGGELIVIDYKNGVQRVEVEHNKQVMGYALGYVVKTKRTYRRIKLVIIQPNTPGRDPVVTHEITWAELLLFGERMHAAVNLVHGKTPAFQAGDHCQWCRAAGNCKEYANRALAVARLEFKDLEEPDMPSNDLDNDEMSAVLKNARLLRSWLDAIEAEATHRLLHDSHSIPGFKLVCSTPRRRWADDDKVLAALTKIGATDDLSERVPLSPAQMQKTLTQKCHPSKWASYWQQFARAIVTNPVEPRLAPLDDTRQPFTPGAEFNEAED